jgi:hypothetical protein
MGTQRRAPQPNLAYRTAPEAQILQMLKLGGFAFDIEDGREAEADRLAQAALSTWVDQGLGYRWDASGGRCFDPAEVLNTMKWQGLAGQDAFWRERYVATGRKLVQELEKASDPGGPALRLRLKRTFGAQHFSADRRWRLRLPLPLDNSASGRPHLAVEGLAQGAFREDVSPGRFEVRFEGRATGAVSLAADLTFCAPAPTRPLDLSAAEAALYTQRSEGFIQVTPAIEQLAEQLSAGVVDTDAMISSFWTYLTDEMACGAVRYGELSRAAPADGCFETRWYDCQLGAALLAALCRAKGVPARIVGGYVAYRLAPTNHYWAEIWIPSEGWRVYDFLSWDLSCGGADPTWRDHFAGRADLRIVTERYPRFFTGLGGLHLPADWQMLQHRHDEGVAVDYRDVSGVNIYSDYIAISYL